MSNLSGDSKMQFKLYFFVAFLMIIMCNSIFGSIVRPEFGWERKLRSKGYSTETPEDIITTLESESYFVRFIGMQLLASRIGKDAKPIIKKCLDDESIEVRWRAARLLGTFGDKSGLQQMQKDYKELLPRNGAAEPTDPDIIGDAKKLKSWERKRRYRIKKGLEVANVLVELGDRRGYDVAAKEALENPGAASRYRAVEVLVRIAKTDKSILSAEGKKPVSILCTVAEIEKKRSVLMYAVGCVAKQLGKDDAIRVLEKAKNSTHCSELDRRIVKSYLMTKREQTIIKD